eukprot:CAMPEP_0173395846 /NCGR_PEP_ID=MMETSP1356-20130122/33580_1 /TAXON_ID=77927 ORGANISM="Hemiselmis virescens, Strain PCC157" /NCGR_SAMPLE_ID=MMETSP1356 /ASSEMBLY_ACC=CAM_ASM_000847 /LENGTH=78 /DNA_ID=CAMNT_0014354707 /DNA_START=532 /DNA_END=768 /DNA_ORIENTATION=+
MERGSLPPMTQSSYRHALSAKLDARRRAALKSILVRSKYAVSSSDVLKRPQRTSSGLHGSPSKCQMQRNGDAKIRTVE